MITFCWIFLKTVLKSTVTVASNFFKIFCKKKIIKLNFQRKLQKYFLGKVIIKFSFSYFSKIFIKQSFGLKHCFTFSRRFSKVWIPDGVRNDHPGLGRHRLSRGLHQLRSDQLPARSCQMGNRFLHQGSRCSQCLVRTGNFRIIKSDKNIRSNEGSL